MIAVAGRHCGFIDPVMVEGINLSIGITAVVVCKQPAPPEMYVTVLFPIEAKEGVNIPVVDVAAVKLQDPPVGNADKVNEEAFEHFEETAVIVGDAGLATVKVVVPMFEHEAAAIGVTVTEYCVDDEIVAIGFEILGLLKPAVGSQL